MAKRRTTSPTTDDRRPTTDEFGERRGPLALKVENERQKIDGFLSSIFYPLSSILYPRWSVVVGRCLLVVGLAMMLSGCLMMSGEQTSADAQPAGGNMSTTFVSAEGGQERTVETGAGPTTLNVITTVKIQQGELRLELLAPNGGVVLSIQGRPDEAVTKLGKVPTDSEGKLHYRVIARGARNGSYEVFYQPAEP